MIQNPRGSEGGLTEAFQNAIHQVCGKRLLKYIVASIDKAVDVRRAFQFGVSIGNKAFMQNEIMLADPDDTRAIMKPAWPHGRNRDYHAHVRRAASATADHEEMLEFAGTGRHQETSPDLCHRYAGPTRA